MLNKRHGMADRPDVVQSLGKLDTSRMSVTRDGVNALSRYVLKASGRVTFPRSNGHRPTYLLDMNLFVVP